jgi:mRNA-degrading endonuclease RelE of RelBE toxin-antitoxin system
MYVRNHFWRRIVANLKKLPASKWREILDKIQEQLSRQPIRETRNKKILEGLQPPWKHRQPMWELRVGEYRVFYDVDPEENRVMVRALRHKPPHRTTEEIL